MIFKNESHGLAAGDKWITRGAVKTQQSAVRMERSLFKRK